MTLHVELRDLARQLEHVHRWTPAQWEEVRRLLQEFLEPLTLEDLQAYERSMQVWIEGAKQVPRARS